MKSLKDLLSQLESSPIGNDESKESSTFFNDSDINALKGQAELDALTIENKLRSEELANRQQDRLQRKQYALYSLWFLVAYMAIVFFIILAEGFCWWDFYLEYGIMIALITTMTANVIGIFAFVMKYLFSKKENYKNNKE